MDWTPRRVFLALDERSLDIFEYETEASLPLTVIQAFWVDAAEEEEKIEVERFELDGREGRLDDCEQFKVFTYLPPIDLSIWFPLPLFPNHNLTKALIMPRTRRYSDMIRATLRPSFHQESASCKLSIASTLRTIQV